jgi:hypothetical protein
MNIFSFIADIFAPAAKLIDDVHTSTEEKLQLKNALTVLQNEMHSKVIDYETKILESKTAIITAEANGQSWLQRSWRPVTMLTFLFLVVCDSFGWLANPLAAEAWTLLQIGLGGYVAGRSGEKMVESFKKKS